MANIVGVQVGPKELVVQIIQSHTRQVVIYKKKNGYAKTFLLFIISHPSLILQ